MRAKPVFDKILVLPLKPEEMTKGGLHIPEKAKEKPNMGRVMAVGPGRWGYLDKRLKMSIKVGQVVMFGKYAGSMVGIDGVDYHIMREEEVLSVAEDVVESDSDSGRSVVDRGDQAGDGGTDDPGEGQGAADNVAGGPAARPVVS